MRVQSGRRSGRPVEIQQRRRRRPESRPLASSCTAGALLSLLRPSWWRGHHIYRNILLRRQHCHYVETVGIMVVG
eukprot:scaffold294727_cov15-Prasinocladus_malaysianus.AAC.1